MAGRGYNTLFVALCSRLLEKEKVKSVITLVFKKLFHKMNHLDFSLLLLLSQE